MNGTVHLEKIEINYDKLKALDSITLDIDPDQIITFLGVNGSGKTSLLKILAGLEEPSKGDVLLGSRKISPAELRQISTLVFQKTVMFNTNVFNNIRFGLKIRGVPKETIEKRVIDVLACVGLTGFQKRKARMLSGGEQQRVALARAFVLEPKLLLLDEPTANLDPANAIILENAIKTIRKESACTIVLATHNLHQAKRLSDRIIHIHHGKIIEQASPQEFFSHPSNDITKKFINGELQF